MKTPLALVGVAIVALGLLALGTFFTVDQRTQAIVMQFGNPVRVIKEPGLQLKMPLLQNVIYFDKRILNLDPPSEEMVLSDQKRINVDAYARYRIVDPLKFYQSMINETNLRDRFGRTLNSSVRNVLGQNDLADLLSPKRTAIIGSIQDQVKTTAIAFGIEVMDVRIGRTELPTDTSNSVYQRMRSEREQEANKLRAEGDELKQRITADAETAEWVWYPPEVIPGKPDSVLEWRPVSAEGKAYSFTTVIRSLLPGDHKAEVPYTVILFEPDDAPGVRIAGILVDDDGVDPACDMRLRFRPVEAGDHRIAGFAPVR